MARHLVVAHQTANSPELHAAIAALIEGDKEASFTLLVPMTRVAHLATWTKGESEAAAREAGDRARTALEGNGVTIDDVIIGDEDPIYAVADAFRHADFDRVLVSTLPLGVSRWSKMDVVSRISRNVDVPVSHVVADSSAPAK